MRLAGRSFFPDRAGQLPRLPGGPFELYSATDVAQSLTLPGPEGTPDYSGRVLEHARQASR